MMNSGRNRRHIYKSRAIIDACMDRDSFLEIGKLWGRSVVTGLARLVHFVDIPGFVIGVEGEKAGTIRHGARAMAAVYQATVPWCSIMIRKAFGVAGAAHSNHSRLHYRYAWPLGDWGAGLRPPTRPIWRHPVTRTHCCKIIRNG